jgi:hypothetical protein
MELWPDCTCCHGAPLPHSTRSAEKPISTQALSPHNPSGEHIFHSMPLQNTHGDSTHSGTCHPLSPRSKVARRQYSVRAPMAHASVAHTHVRSLLLLGRHTPHTMTQATLVFPHHRHRHTSPPIAIVNTPTHKYALNPSHSQHKVKQPPSRASGQWASGPTTYPFSPRQPPRKVSTFNFTIIASLTSFGAINNR